MHPIPDFRPLHLIAQPLSEFPSFLYHIFAALVRFGCSLWFCYLEFDKKEPISDGCMSENGRCRCQGLFEL